jgi:hypothetical protein
MTIVLIRRDRHVSVSILRFVLRVFGFAALLTSGCLVVYVIYAVCIGKVMLGTRTGDVAALFELSPIFFLVGVGFYIAGAALFFWIGRGLLARRDDTLR